MTFLPYPHQQLLWGVGFCLLRLAAAASLVPVPAASNSTAHKVSITADGKAVPFYRCFINSSSLRNRNLSQYKLHSSSTRLLSASST